MSLWRFEFDLCEWLSVHQRMAALIEAVIYFIDKLASDHPPPPHQVLGVRRQFLNDKTSYLQQPIRTKVGGQTDINKYLQEDRTLCFAFSLCGRSRISLEGRQPQKFVYLDPPLCLTEIIMLLFI